MAQIKPEERIIYAKEKEEVFDVSPDKITVFTGDELIGGVSQGTVAENARPNITAPLQSPNFKQGTTGWRLNSNGILEANGAIIT
jgi:hypothetical protein